MKQWLCRASRYSFWLFIALVVTLFFAMIIQQASGVVHPMVFDRCFAIVESGSMEPEIPTKSVVLIQRKPSYAVGDIVTYIDYRGVSVTHRVVSLQEGVVLAKGDANDYSDIPFSEEDIVGVVTNIFPTAGKIISFFKNPVIVIIAVNGVFVLAVYHCCEKLAHKRKASGAKKSRWPEAVDAEYEVVED